MIPAREALELLREGNRRFVAGSPRADALVREARRQQLVEGQAPFAVILGCADSRVPVEIIFDQGLGDLFVIRVAGNIVAPSLVGSVEFAVEKFGTRLVVVLGHSRCGAVTATVEELARPGGVGSPNLRSIVERIRPAVEELVAADTGDDRDALIHRAVRANVRASVGQLRHGSRILEEKMGSGELWVVGAEYSLESGAVEPFDGVPAI